MVTKALMLDETGKEMVESLDRIAEALTPSDVTVEGNPITFDSPFEQDAKSVVVSVKPIQDLHGYDHPWPAGGGKNKCDWNVSTTSDKLSIALSPNTYTISAKSTLSAGNWYFRFTDVNDNYISSPSAVGLNGYAFAESGWIYGGSNSQVVTFTIPSDCKLLEVGKLNADGTIPAQIEVGSQATTWEPYSNICPISGIDEVKIPVTGKNLFDKDHINSFSGFIEIASHKFKEAYEYRIAYISCMPNTTYTISKEAGKTFRVADSVSIPAEGVEYINTDANHTGTSITFTTSVNAKYLAVLYWSSANQDVLTPEELAASLQLELGSIPTDFEPYVSHTTTIPLPSTLYGGTVDVTNGIDTPTYGMVTENNIANIRGVSSGGLYWCDIDAGAIDSSESKASILPKKDGNSAWRSSENCYTIANDTNKIRLYFKSSTEADAKLELAGLQIAYELATHTTISFDPTDVELLEGTNVVTTNGESIELTYGKSFAQAIDEIETAVAEKLNKSDVADVEGDTASKAYSVNDFMLRSDGFYQVTQPIASGASITSSNTTKTTIGAVLTALLNA